MATRVSGHYRYLKSLSPSQRVSSPTQKMRGLLGGTHSRHHSLEQCDQRPCNSPPALQESQHTTSTSPDEDMSEVSTSSTPTSKGKISATASLPLHLLQRHTAINQARLRASSPPHRLAISSSQRWDEVLQRTAAKPWPFYKRSTCLLTKTTGPARRKLASAASSWSSNPLSTPALGPAIHQAVQTGICRAGVRLAELI